jgi:hypothetical protein
MSMPRDELSSQQGMGCARFIGRVGALAVAMGLGAAIANSPGIAWADTHESDSSSSESTGSSASKESPSKNDGPSTSPAATHTPSVTQATSSTSQATSEQHSGVTKAIDEESETGPAPAVSTAEPSSVDATPAESKSKKPGSRSAATSRAVDAPAVSSERRTVGDEQPEPRSTPAAQVRPAAAEPEADHPQAAQAEVRRLAAVTDVDAAPTAAATPKAVVTPASSASATPVGVVTGLVSGLLSAVGLNPQATTDPVTPPQGPALWTMLGWVRREIGYVVKAGAAATATATGVTSLVVPTVSAAATSPLGTPQQLTAEQVATATVNTLPVQLMKFVLRLGWMNSAQQQFAGGPDQENIDQLANAVDEYAMGAAFQQQLLNSNAPTVVSQVWPGHSWYGQDVGGSRILYDNPDTIYRFMGVNAASSYVITGRFAGGVPADTNFSLLTGLSGVTADNLSGRDLLVDSDGSFTITVSTAPKQPGENHLQLTSDSTLIAARNTLSDWNGQEPMSLSIQRISGPPNSLFSQLGGFAIPVIGPQVASNPFLTTLVSLIPPLADPPPLLRGAVTAVVMILGLQMEPKYIAVATTDPATGQRSQPNVLSQPARNAEFLATQLQSAGYFQLTDQQALVVTIDPGDARYFVVPVTNDWTITNNYWDQQTSLNNVQALADPDDGVYTLVISPTDPDVANWVSTGGLNQGTISIRFQDLPLNPTHLPTVTSRVVSLDQLPTVLPANTVYVTPEQRQAQIAARKTGFDNRFAPYPQV